MVDCKLRDAPCLPKGPHLFIFYDKYSFLLGHHRQLNPYGWYSMGRHHLGKLSFKLGYVQPFNLEFPPTLQLDFHEVLVYVSFTRGSARGSAGGEGYYRIHTQDAYGVYEQFVDFSVSSSQDSCLVSSGNIWLPLTSERRVYATYTGSPISGDVVKGELFLVAFK